MPFVPPLCRDDKPDSLAAAPCQQPASYELETVGSLDLGGSSLEVGRACTAGCCLGFCTSDQPAACIQEPAAGRRAYYGTGS